MYTDYIKPFDKVMGKCFCDVCGNKVDLIKRSGMGWARWYYECATPGHSKDLIKYIEDNYKIGDRIKVYNTSFKRPTGIDSENYKEGVIIKKTLSIISYELIYKIDKVVINGEVCNHSWLNGHVTPVSSNGIGIELVK